MTFCCFVFLTYEEAAKLGKLATNIKSRYRNSLILDRMRIFELAPLRNYYYQQEQVTGTQDDLVLLSGSAKGLPEQTVHVCAAGCQAGILHTGNCENE